MIGNRLARNKKECLCEVTSFCLTLKNIGDVNMSVL